MPVIGLAVSLGAVAPVWADLIVTSLGAKDTTNNDPFVHVNPSNLPSLAGGVAPFEGLMGSISEVILMGHTLVEF